MVRRRLRQLRRQSERGTVIVLVAGMLTALMASGAVAIDLSAGRATRQRVQTAADAAALAAADVIPANNNSTNVPAVSATATTMPKRTCRSRRFW